MARAAGASRFINGAPSLDIPAGAEIVRVHWQANGPVFFGPPPGNPPANRFDAPAGEFRVLYGALELPGAYVETVLRRPGRIMRRGDAEARAATRLQIQRPLSLVKVFDEGLQRLGVHVGEITVDDYAPCRRLALDLHREFPHLDGLAYRSRYDNGQVCYALFDRVDAADLLPMDQLNFDKHPAVVDNLMRRYGAVFDTSAPP